MRKIKYRTQTNFIHNNYFLAALFVVLILLFTSIITVRENYIIDVRIVSVGFLVLLTSLVALVTLDQDKPDFLGITGGFLLIISFSIIFYLFSGANWYLLERMFFNKEVIRVSWPILLTGLGKTFGLFLWSAFFSIIIGLFFAVIIYMNNKVFNFFIILYVDFFRSIPHLVLIVVIYYALPFLGINFKPYAAGVIGLTFATSSFITEYFRAGIESVSKGQIEAAHSLGFGFFKSMRIVILPQALRVVIPPLTGQLVGLFKKTALVSVVGMQELLKRSVEVMEWKTNPTPLIVVTVMYLIILLPFAQLSIYLEKRMKKWTKRTI